MEFNIKLSEIAEACGGKLYGDGDRVINNFFLDSRKAEKNQMFIPFVGEKVDAHNFIDGVFAKGSASFSQKIIENAKGDYVLVKDSRKALQDVALYHRQTLEIPLIAVTGSVGKTSMKEMLATVLESSLKTSKTLWNANSQVGLPLTLLKINNEHECAVIEMGMSYPGEMERITNCARPDMAVFTNIGVSHIEYHGSREKIMEAKLHITDHFTKESTLFVNSDDDLLCTLKDNVKYNVINFGLGENVDYRAVDLTENNGGTSFKCVIFGKDEVEIFLPTLGEHNVRNALAAFAVADTLKIDRKSAVQGVANFTPPAMRQEIIKFNDFTVIDDTYNASPDSTKFSLDVLTKLDGKQKIAVLADMLELGEHSKTGHEEVGAYAKKLGIHKLICFGDEAIHIYNGFNDKDNSAHFTDYNLAEEYLLELIHKNSVLLVKGSRGMKADRFIKAIKEKF